MIVRENRRLRDPIHGLILFDKEDDADMLAWELMRAPEFQRLRRIRQLGVSDFVYPGATHSRLSHSIGVYHTARLLMRVIKRSLGDAFDPDRALVVRTAALLHDLGHGPFSHAFENAREVIAHDRGVDDIESHEKFTAGLITDENGGTLPIFEEFDTDRGRHLAEEVAALIRAEDPTDIYHAVVSSSFDADRLDYLLRDRYMTGIGAAAIDVDWLIDNLGTDEISVQQEGAPEHRVPTFVFKWKGRQAAEDFLLARYRLFVQVYLHKTTRGFEQLISALFRRIAELSDAPERIGLDAAHPLVRFLRPDGGTIANYRELDDAVVWGAIERTRRAEDRAAKRFAERLWQREPLDVVDIQADFGQNVDTMHNAVKRGKAFAGDALGKTMFLDEAQYNLYSRSNGDFTKEHKKVRVRVGGGALREIVDFDDTVISRELTKKQKLTRFYFLSSEEKDAAERRMRGR